MTRQLEEQTSRMAVTLSSIGDGVITSDTSNRVLWMNPEAERLTGWALGDAVGKPSRSVFHVTDEKTGLPAPDALQRSLSARQQVQTETDIDLRSKDGKTIAVEGSAAPILGDMGEAIGAVLVFRTCQNSAVSSGRLPIVPAMTG